MMLRACFTTFASLTLLTTEAFAQTSTDAPAPPAPTSNEAPPIATPPGAPSVTQTPPAFTPDGAPLPPWAAPPFPPPFVPPSQGGSAPPSMPTSLPVKPERRWYGWQVLTAVGISDTLFLVGVSAVDGAGATALGTLGALGHLFSGAGVHFAHQNWKMGGASIGLNVGAPLVLGLTGGLIGVGACAAGAGGNSDFGCLAAIGLGAGGGMIVGGIAATIIDSAVFAYEPVGSPKANPARHPFSTVALVPLFDRSRVGLSLVGQF